MNRIMRALWMAAAVLIAAPAIADTVKVTFVQTNDIDRMEERDGRGGFARVMAVVAAERAKGPTFFVHSGDTLSPSLLSGIDKGAHIIDILNQMGVDAMVARQSRVRFRARTIFRTRIGEAKFPVSRRTSARPTAAAAEHDRREDRRGRRRSGSASTV